MGGAKRKVGNLGRYRLIAELARGGMGVVYLALVKGPGGFNKLFVVKELKAHLAEDPQLVAMFLEEARLAAKLSHPNVVQTIEVGSDGDRHYIAMEYLDGQSLNRVRTRLTRTKARFPLAYHLYIIAHTLEGLQYAHAVTDFDGTTLNLVHRDVSPHNVFVTYDGQIKVVDFGIAKALGSANHTRTGVLKGKLAYMAPEQTSGEPIDHRADLFAAGIMLWEAAVGKRMWAKFENEMGILHALIRGAIPNPREANPEIDAELEQIILKATAVYAGDRYNSAAEFRSDLEAYLRGSQLGVLPREVGLFLGDLFAQERTQIKSIIDEQLQLLRGTSSADYATLDLPLLSAASSSPSATPSRPSGTPSAVMLAGGSKNVVPSSAAGQRAAPLFAAPGDLSPDTASDARPPLPARRSRAALGALAATGVAIVAGALTLIVRHSLEPSTSPVLASADAPVVASAGAAPLQSGLARAEPPPPATAQLDVAVSPAAARISIDDGAPQTGAFLGTFPRDGRPHSIRVEAPGFETKLLSFSADESRTFDISLVPVVTQAASPHSGHRPHPPSEPRPTPPAEATQTTPTTPTTQTAPKPSPKQQIDVHDPYAN